MCIRLFSSEMELSILRLVSEIPVLRLLLFCEVGVKEINLGIIFPPRAVTLIIALRVPLGPRKSESRRIFRGVSNSKGSVLDGEADFVTTYMVKNIPTICTLI